MKCILSWFTIIAVIVVGVLFFWTDRTHAPALPINIAKPVISAEATKDPNIEVTAPTTGKKITSPLTITGKARGSWYFEGSFPIFLKDSNGSPIATTNAQAQGSWMTSNFVPFTATLIYPSQPVGSTGVLIITNDNPSGEPQNAKSVTIPVQF